MSSDFESIEHDDEALSSIEDADVDDVKRRKISSTIAVGKAAYDKSVYEKVKKPIGDYVESLQRSSLPRKTIVRRVNALVRDIITDRLGTAASSASSGATGGNDLGDRRQYQFITPDFAANLLARQRRTPTLTPSKFLLFELCNSSHTTTKAGVAFTAPIRLSDCVQKWPTRTSRNSFGCSRLPTIARCRSCRRR